MFWVLLHIISKRVALNIIIVHFIAIEFKK
jgi:hypothetical protein